MNSTLIYLNLRKKSDGGLSDLENEFINQYKQLHIVSEILVDESKGIITSKSAINKIREILNKYN